MKKRRKAKVVLSIEKQAEQAILGYQKRLQLNLSENAIIINAVDKQLRKVKSFKRPDKLEIEKLRSIIRDSGRRIDAYCETIFKLDTALALIQRKINPS